MSINLKLIGYNWNDYNIILESKYFTLLGIYDFMIEKGIELNHLHLIKFIINGETIKDINKKYEIDDNIITNIYIFSQDKNIRDIISSKIFQNIDISTDNTITIQQTVDDLDSITKEDRHIINQQIIEQFKDPDFKKLFEICITKPYLLGIVNNYISNGNITGNIHIINETDDFHYMDTYNEIEKLGFSLNNTILLKSIITHFEGSINLTIRYILLKNLMTDTSNLL